MSPEEYRDALSDGNFWAETGLTAKFFFVDGAFGLILMISTLNLFSVTTWTVLGVSFMFFSILAKLDVSIGEFGYAIWSVLCKKKYRRY